jgi:hypothetical protein
VQNGLIPIAYRRDIRSDRIHVLPRACFWFFLLGLIALVEPIAHAYVRMKDFDPYTQTVHTHTRTLSVSPIFTRTPASRYAGVQMPTVLSFLLYNMPTPRRGHACVHARMQAVNACT